MKTNLKRKNIIWTRKRSAGLGGSLARRLRPRRLNLVVFRKEILKSLEKVAGKGGVEKGF